MGVVPAAFVCLTIPTLLGCLLLRRLWPGAPATFSVALGAGVGTGLAGALYVLALTITDSATSSLSITEVFLVAGTIALACTKSPPPDSLADVRFDKTERSILLIAGSLAALSLVFLSGGDPDRVESADTWQVKARFIYRSADQPLERILNPTVADNHPDQPLLFPSLVARGWLYAGQESRIFPTSISVLFALCTVLTLTGGVKIIGNGRQACLAGCVLMATPLFLRSSAFTPTNTAFVFFTTATIAIIGIHDIFEPQRYTLPLLSGIAAGLAAATKSEGLLLVIALCLARLLLPSSQGSSKARRRGVAWIAAGAFPGVLATLLLWYLVPTADVATTGGGTALALSRLLSVDFQLNVLGGVPWRVVTFGGIGLVPLVAFHFITSRRPLTKPGAAALHRAGLALVGVLLGEYGTRLTGPYLVARDLSPAFPDLLLAIWPSALLLYSMCVSGPSTVEENSVTNRGAQTALVLGIALLCAFGLETGRQHWNRPKLTVSRSEVTAGVDSYVLKIQGMEGFVTFVRYTLNGGPVQEFPARLDAAGEIRFEVEATTPKGRYHFTEFREDGTENWIPTDTYITVK